MTRRQIHLMAAIAVNAALITLALALANHEARPVPQHDAMAASPGAVTTSDADPGELAEPHQTSAPPPHSLRRRTA